MCSAHYLRYISGAYFSKADAIMLVYDPNDTDGLDVARAKLEQVRKRAPETKLLLVANKCDLPHPREEGEAFASANGM